MFLIAIGLGAGGRIDGDSKNKAQRASDQSSTSRRELKESLNRFREFVEYLVKEQYTVVSLRDIENYVEVKREPEDPLSSVRFFR